MTHRSFYKTNSTFIKTNSRFVIPNSPFDKTHSGFVIICFGLEKNSTDFVKKNMRFFNERGFFLNGFFFFLHRLVWI
ncbi:hypothetical protein ABIE54_007539 [Chitinophagaceae bacterium OAS944]